MELVQLVNGTSLGEVAGSKVLHHRIRAGVRIAAKGDTQRVDLLKYVSWLIAERHEHDNDPPPAIPAEPKSDTEIRDFQFKPNRGAQSDFLRSKDLYPYYCSGLGSGKTWGGSAKVVMLHAYYPGTDTLCVAPTYPNLRQITLPALCERLDEIGIPYKTRTSDVMEIHTPTLGSKILLHSGLNAERITGFEVGRAWIDEPARIPDFPDPKRRIWGNTLARVRSRFVPPSARVVMLTGTHEGKGTWIWKGWERNPLPGHVLYRGTTWENPDGQEYAQTLVDEYGPELAAQYVMGGAVDDSLPAIAYSVIESMVSSRAHRVPDWPSIERATTLFVGMDIGRSKSLTVFWICSLEKGVLVCLGCLELVRTPFGVQFDTLRRIMQIKRVRKIAIDATYNPSTAEDAVNLWGSRVDPVIFTQRSKLEIVDGLIKVANSGGMLIPDDDEISMDFFSMKRVVKSSGRVSYEAPFSDDGHADRFIAAALCVRASKGGHYEPFQWTGGPKRRSAGMRRV